MARQRPAASSPPPRGEDDAPRERGLIEQLGQQAAVSLRDHGVVEIVDEQRAARSGVPIGAVERGFDRVVHVHGGAGCSNRLQPARLGRGGDVDIQREARVLSRDRQRLAEVAAAHAHQPAMPRLGAERLHAGHDAAPLERAADLLALELEAHLGADPRVQRGHPQQRRAVRRPDDPSPRTLALIARRRRAGAHRAPAAAGHWPTGRSIPTRACTPGACHGCRAWAARCGGTGSPCDTSRISISARSTSAMHEASKSCCCPDRINADATRGR
jgi:hypothetical protein